MGVFIAKGERAATRCACVARAIQERAVRQAAIPPRFSAATLETFLPAGRGKSIQAAYQVTRGYARDWLPGSPDNGLLIHGPVGTGKTHLAVAILRELLATKGARCLFVDFRDLLKRVQASYSDPTQSEARILEPVFRADVVVLDELGAMRSTEWVADCIERILGERYNSGRTTIVTTNYPMAGPANIHEVDGGPMSYARAAATAMREETIGDRVGARMHSRLSQMCRALACVGTDYRVEERKRALR